MDPISDWDREVDESSPNKILAQLFDDALARDEFEFCCAILRVRGMESAGWNPFYESLELIEQFNSLVPLAETKLKVRLTLFLYCHMTEMYDFYAIPKNMIRILEGKRYSLSPFSRQAEPEEREEKYPGGKVARLCASATSIDAMDVKNLFDSLLIKEVRNAFYHSDYFLTEDSFVIRNGVGITLSRLTKKNIPFSWLMPRLYLGINTGLALLDLLFAYRASYTENKLVSGRMGGNGEYTDIELLASEESGLYGFQSAGI